MDWMPTEQRRPWLPGWSGLPSTLTMRPSRLRSSVPQPALHSLHADAKKVETPGTTWSGWTTYGRTFSMGVRASIAAPVVAANAAVAFVAPDLHEVAAVEIEASLQLRSAYLWQV